MVKFQYVESTVWSTVVDILFQFSTYGDVLENEWSLPSKNNGAQNHT